MLPFINDLIEDARVGVLGRKAQAEQFDPQPGDLLDQVRHIGEPPAAENVQITKLARQHAQLVLVFARQRRDHELILWKTGAQILHHGQVAQARAVAGQFKLRVNRAPHARHQRERKAMLAAMRQHRFLNQLGADVFRWKFKIGG